MLILFHIEPILGKVHILLTGKAVQSIETLLIRYYHAAFLIKTILCLALCHLAVNLHMIDIQFLALCY